MLLLLLLMMMMMGRLLVGRRLTAVSETDGTRAVVRARRARRRRAVALVGDLGRGADHLGRRLCGAAEREGRVAQPTAEPREQRVAPAAGGTITIATAAVATAAVIGALRRREVVRGCVVGHVQPRHLVAAVPAAVIAIVIAIVIAAAAAVAAAKLRRQRRRGDERVGRAGREPAEAEA